MNKKFLFVLLLVFLGTYKVEVKATNERGFVTELSSSEKVEPPSFVEYPQNITARVGENVVMKIKVAGVPLPRIRVFKTYEEILPSDRIQYTISLNIVTITITSVRKEDAGIYSIELANSAGTASYSWRLNVEDDVVL